jgi:hypothetical protein
MPVPGRPFHDLRELLRRQLRLAQRQCVAAVALVAGRIPFMAILTHRLALEYLLAKLELTGLLRGGRILGGGRTGQQEFKRQKRCRGDFARSAKYAAIEETHSNSHHCIRAPPLPHVNNRIAGS